MGSIGLKAKGTPQKHCDLVDKVFSLRGHDLRIMTLRLDNEVNRGKMVGAKVFIWCENLRERNLE